MRACRPRRRLPEQADPRAHHLERRRHQRHLHARARRGTAQEPRPAADHRQPSGRRRQYRRARLPGCTAGRLHHLHHQCRSDDLQPVPLQESAVRSRQACPDHQSVPPDPGAGDQLRSQGQNGGRAGRGVEAEAGHALLSHRVGAAGCLHGQPQARKGRRLGARAVQGRRRGDQRDPRRLDADRPDRARQRDLADPRRQDDGAGADQQHPHAAVAGRADAGRPRLQGRAVADLVRAVRAARHAAADHRQDRARSDARVRRQGLRREIRHQPRPGAGDQHAGAVRRADQGRPRRRRRRW